MANIVITTNGNLVHVDFGNYSVSQSVDGKKASYLISDISIVWMEKDDSVIYVKMKDAITTNNWRLSWEYLDNETFVVDSINGVAPTSNQDLMDKINAIR
jgi:hypothetical protein